MTTHRRPSSAGSAIGRTGQTDRTVGHDRGAEPSDPTASIRTSARLPTGFSHAAVYTSDIDRFRRFYETVVGLRMGVLLQMDAAPYYRHAIFPLGEVATLHVFEMPGYDPQSDGIGTEIGQRGRIDHFGFEVNDRADLEALRERVTAAGASDGEIRPLGPSWSLHFRDPDGLSVEVNCRRAIPPGELRPESLLEIGDPDLGRVHRRARSLTAHSPAQPDRHQTLLHPPGIPGRPLPIRPTSPTHPWHPCQTSASKERTVTSTLTHPTTTAAPTTAPTPTSTDLLERARSLAPALRDRAAEGDRLRHLPDDLAGRIREAGLLRMLMPTALGGIEVDMPTVVEIIEVLSHADGSAGWTTLIGNSSAFFAWLDPDAAAAMLRDAPAPVSTSMFGPHGQAVDNGDGTLTIDGRWPYNSGVTHADWCQVGIMVMDGDRPRLRPDGRPDWRFAFFPRDRATVIDTWDSLGLRGTGSHDVVVSGLVLPEVHTAMPMFDLPRHDGPLWRLSFWTLITGLMAGFPLGVGRRALDEFTALAVTKRRGPSPTTVAEDHHVQIELARVEGGLRAARSFVLDAVGDCWRTVLAGATPTPEQDASVLAQLPAGHAGRPRRDRAGLPPERSRCGTHVDARAALLPRPRHGSTAPGLLRRSPGRRGPRPARTGGSEVPGLRSHRADHALAAPSPTRPPSRHRRRRRPGRPGRRRRARARGRARCRARARARLGQARDRMFSRAQWPSGMPRLVVPAVEIGCGRDSR